MASFEEFMESKGYDYGSFDRPDEMAGLIEEYAVSHQTDAATSPSEAPGSTASLREALEEIRDTDQRRQYETCPDCMYDECQKKKKCRSVPLSHVGVIADEALGG